MRKWGFVLSGGGTWTHPAVGEVQWASPDTRKVLGRTGHVLREAFRRFHFGKFLGGSRRDAAVLGATVYSEAQFKGASKLYSAGNKDERAVLHGAALSVACFARIRREPVPTQCPWCLQAVVPNWHHMVWECDLIARGVSRPARPASGIGQRLGWPLGAATAEDRARLSYMAMIRAEGYNRFGFHAAEVVQDS
jgi:hypothetical protein